MAQQKVDGSQLDPVTVPLLDAENHFTANQTISGTVTMDEGVSSTASTNIKNKFAISIPHPPDNVDQNWIVLLHAKIGTGSDTDSCIGRLYGKRHQQAIVDIATGYSGTGPTTSGSIVTLMSGATNQPSVSLVSCVYNGETYIGLKFVVANFHEFNHAMEFTGVHGSSNTEGLLAVLESDTTSVVEEYQLQAFEVNGQAVALVGTANVFTVTQELASTVPRLNFTETDQGADLKKWNIIASGGSLRINESADDNSTITEVLRIFRGAKALQMSSGDITYDGQSLLYIPLTINTQAGTSYTLLLTDAGDYVRMTSGSANTVTIPTNASVAFDIGTEVIVRQAGAGTTTIAGPGVTINTSNTLVLAAQHDSVSLVKVATDIWDLMGATG